MGKNITIVIADSNLETCEILNDAFSAEKDFKVAGTVGDGKAALELIKRHDPDILIMDFNLSTFDGIKLLERLQEVKKRLPEILIITAVMRESVLNMAYNFGASFIIQKPFNARTVVERVRQITNRMPELTAKTAVQERSLESTVTDILRGIGIPAHLKGFKYLREAIVLTVNDMDIINSMTKVLYPTVAERFNTNWGLVERDIRSAVEVAWDRGDIEALQKLFGYTVSGKRGKPTNTEFIALIADKIYLDQKDREWRHGKA
jgi:two-component system response regulator (stage 0 sporulation protein A)